MGGESARLIERCPELTVEVISDEQTSQIYFAPPSVPREPVFFLMTPMLPFYREG
jgi:hypothetical protein